MSKKTRLLIWSAVLLPCLFLAAILVAPQIQAGVWRPALVQELSRALGRRVDVQDVRYMLYPSPGLSASNLVIPDDPAYGIEPFAYVTELQVGVRLRSLLFGRLEVSSVRLVDASVNLSHTAARGWNVNRLLKGMAEAARRGNPPALELRACRVNFRFGLVKSSYYLNNMDLDLDPPSEASRSMQWSFEASPARTDRAEQGFGRFTSEGVWSPSVGRDGTIEATTELQTSALSEVVTLLAGQDLGLQGRLTSRARMSGPLDQIRVTGKVEFMEVDHAGLFGLEGKQFQLPLEGKVDVPGQAFDLHMAAQPSDVSEQSLEIRLTSSDTLLDPRWKAAFLFKSFPAATVAELARRLGSGLPQGVEAAGEVNGSLAFERNGPASGQIAIKQASLKLAGDAGFTAPEVALSVTGGEIRLAPAEIKAGNGVEAVVSGVWNMGSGERQLEMKLTDAPLVSLKQSAGEFTDSIPFLRACSEGRVTGTFHYRSVAESPWAGSTTLIGLKCEVQGLASPLSSGKSTLVLREDGWLFRSLDAEIGSMAGSVDLAFKRTARRPLRIQALIREADAAGIERLLSPTLSRRRSLLDRTLSFGRSRVPDWLAGRSLSGHLRIDRLLFLGVEAAPFETNLFWDGSTVELSSTSMRISDSAFTGRISVALGGTIPEYRVLGRLDDFPHDSIKATVDMDLSTSGVGRSLLDNLRAAGEFQILGAEVEGDRLQSLRGTFDYAARRAGPRLRIGSAEAGIDGEVFTGSGAVAPDGRLQFDLATPVHSRRLIVTLSPWQIETR